MCGRDTTAARPEAVASLNEDHADMPPQPLTGVRQSRARDALCVNYRNTSARKFLRPETSRHYGREIACPPAQRVFFPFARHRPRWGHGHGPARIGILSTGACACWET